MKILASILIGLGITAAAQANDLVVVHSGGKTGTNAIIANEYLTEFQRHYSKVSAIGPGGCRPALDMIKKNPRQSFVFLYDVSSLGASECRDELLSMKSTAVFGVHHWLCTSAENQLTLQDFLKGGHKVGLSTPFPLWKSWYDEALAITGGRPATGVPVGDSGKLVLSLLNKETDWTLLNGQRAKAQMEANKLKCVATTNPSGEVGLPYLGNSIPNFKRNRVILGWNTVVINAGADQRKIESLLQGFHNGNFRLFAEKNLITDTTNSDAKTRDNFYQAMLDYVMPDRNKK
jgi:hypothetical protein